MATRFIEQATQQLAPVYDTQIAGLQQQVPAIQNLYATLTGALQQQNQQQIQTGTQNILEDASRRGVLRSTLPVDARQALTAELGAALTQGLGQIGLQQMQDIGGVNERIGALGVQRAGSIADLARALETQDLQRQQFDWQRQMDERNLQLQQQQLAAQRSSSSGSTSAEATTRAAASALARELQGVAGPDGYVSPQDYAAGRREWVAAGFSSKTYDDYFAGFKNPQNTKYKYF